MVNSECILSYNIAISMILNKLISNLVYKFAINHRECNQLNKSLLAKQGLKTSIIPRLTYGKGTQSQAFPTLGVYVCHTSRQGNGVTHILASYVMSNSVDFIWSVYLQPI